VRAYAAEVRRLADQLRQAGADATLEQQLERVSGQLARAQASAAGFRNELRSHKAEIEGVGAGLAQLKNIAGELAGALLRASRSIRVTVTKSPGSSHSRIRISSRLLGRAPVTFSV
jgi:hypothetical protein